MRRLGAQNLAEERPSAAGALVLPHAPDDRRAHRRREGVHAPPNSADTECRIASARPAALLVLSHLAVPRLLCAQCVLSRPIAMLICSRTPMPSLKDASSRRNRRGARGDHMTVEFATLRRGPHVDMGRPADYLRVGADDRTSVLNDDYLVLRGGTPLTTTLLCRLDASRQQIDARSSRRSKAAPTRPRWCSTMADLLAAHARPPVRSNGAPCRNSAPQAI